MGPRGPSPCKGKKRCLKKKGTTVCMRWEGHKGVHYFHGSPRKAVTLSDVVDAAQKEGADVHVKLEPKPISWSLRARGGELRCGNFSPALRTHPSGQLPSVHSIGCENVTNHVGPCMGQFQRVVLIWHNGGRDAKWGAPADPKDHGIDCSHYRQGRIQPIDVVRDWDLGFSLGNTVKYIGRAGRKAGETELADLKKALWYLEDRIRELESRTSVAATLFPSSKGGA